MRPVLLFNSYVLLIVGAITMVPFAFSFFEPDPIDFRLFVGMTTACLVLGTWGVRANSRAFGNITSLHLYLITTSCWLLLGVLGSIPFVLGLPHLTVANGLFESFSGITTTGSTVLVNIESLPRSMLIWRGLLQWVGGIGIVVLSISVLPHLRVGGMRFFASESSDWSGKTHSRTRKMVIAIILVYIILSISCMLAYLVGGMSPFDSVVHAMTTLSTGGYANYDASFGYFADRPVIIWTAILFMILGALPFVFYVNMVKRQATHNLLDSQIRGFLIFLAVVIAIFGAVRIQHSGLPVTEAISEVAFNVVSIVTTTGYASTDYTLWGPFAVMLFFFLMFVGGCSGSTSGSIKIFRFQLAFLMLRNQLRQMTYPNGVFALKYDSKVVTDDIIRSVVAFSMFFALAIAVIAIGLAFLGLDFLTSISAATTAVTNVGPGLGTIVGPSGNFAALPDAAKGLLCVGMLIGRLEIMTILILLTPSIWTK